MGLGLPEQDLQEVQEQILDLPDLPPEIQSQIHSHLVVAASGRVEPLPSVADALGQEGLHIHVDILLVGGKGHGPGLHLRHQILQSLDNGFGIRLGDDAGVAQHGRVGQGALHILPRHPLIKADGGIEIVDQLIGLLLKPPGPELHMVHLKLRKNEY